MWFIFTTVFLKVNENAGAFLHLLHLRSLAAGGLSGLFKFRSNAWLTGSCTAAGYNPHSAPEGYYNCGSLQSTTEKPYPFPKAPH